MYSAKFLTAVFLAIAPLGLSAQQYPVKPVRIVTAEPGGGNEFAARVMAQGLTPVLGQQVVVESRGGASGALAAQAVSRAAPDGYTLLIYSSAFWVVPLLKDVQWDTLRDFQPISILASAPNVLVVHPSLPVKNVGELLKLARSRPGDLNYSTGGSGAAAHLAAELFKSLGKVKITRITYKGTGPGLNALMAGEVQVMFPAAGSVMMHVKGGRLKALAVTGPQRTEIAPDLPTIAASGLPGYEAVSVYGLFAPAKTPSALVQRIYQESVKVLRQADTKERFFNAGVETVGASPDDFTAYIKTDIVRWDKVIREAGIREEQ